ncbi:MAG TPA: hypothetical protein VGL81_11005 [Polyangiaceae bacterium]|jgi:hypothetical protein
MLKRDGRFAYRERLWEDDPMRPARGQLDAGLSLVSELAGQINPDYARPARLRQLLANRKRQGGELGFIDDVTL